MHLQEACQKHDMVIVEKNKIIVIFSEKNKMFLMAGEKIMYSLSGPYLDVQNVRKNRMIAQSANTNYLSILESSRSHARDGHARIALVLPAHEYVNGDDCRWPLQRR